MPYNTDFDCTLHYCKCSSICKYQAQVEIYDFYFKKNKRSLYCICSSKKQAGKHGANWGRDTRLCSWCKFFFLCLDPNCLTRGSGKNDCTVLNNTGGKTDKTLFLMFHLTTAPHITESQEFCLAYNAMDNIVYTRLWRN